MIQKADMKLESGTCNVCSAPCSSCMHLNRALMGSKAEEFSDENCRLGETIDEGDGSSHRSGACDRLKHAVSETNNMPSVNSSHDSLSENSKSTRALSERYQDSKCLESLDDNTSCISRTSNANLVSDSHQTNADRINISSSSPSVSHLGVEGSGSRPSVDISGSSEILPSKEANIPENLSKCNVGNVNSLLAKEIAPIIVSGEKSLSDEDNLFNGTTAKVSVKVHPKSEADSDNDVGDVKDEDHKYSVHEGLHVKPGELVKSPGIPDTQSEDETEDSDIVEHDVKVCDICGDAGREDLLAICSRCSDGAEHTYCMREMLQKVPEGEWLCEECKYAEETENQRLDVEKIIHKVSSTSQISGKRSPESIDLATAAKRQALESRSGSPKASSPRRIFPLSRESSFKSLDKGKLKPGHKTSIHNRPSGDDIELARSISTGPRSQTAKSTLFKSNSFNNFNSKPRVKLVDEVVPQKKKGAGEHTSKNMETPARMISKSMSFKSSNLGRSSSTESKVKMLSSKSGTTQDLKGSRLVKESAASDRKFLSRIDRPVVCSTMASSVVSSSKGDQKLTPRGETAKPSVFNNNREYKVNQDGRSSSLSKNSIGRKSMEHLVSSERTPSSDDETQPDRLPQSRETANQVDKTKDASSDRVKPGVTNPSISPFCKKCKDFGHPTEGCMISNTQELGAEASAAAPSSSKEDMDKGNRLKAAIQAALLKRPEIYKKKDVPDRTDEFPTSGTDLNCEANSQDQVLAFNTPKSSLSLEETNVRQEILENPTFETSSSCDLKKLSFCPIGLSSQTKKSDSVAHASGKPVVTNFPNQTMAVSSVFPKISAVPEFEYVWQGVFQVHRSGKPPDLYAGIQAHLSTFASPKVHEVVNKFLPEVSLNEVSRLTTWPSQFCQGGANEDHIALYFFAKDIQSYERYKSLLDHMIRNDLALTGTFDGVELLIFPSNQLPENSQCWNRLFFLWGVFRGQRMNYSDSTKKICILSLNAMPIEKDFPTAVMTVSETRCLAKRVDEESIGCGKACGPLPPPTSMDQGNAMKDGQYGESDPPEVMVTSVSSRIVETKSDYDVSVNQENSLSSGIPSVGNHKIGTSSNIRENNISERKNNDEDQRRLKRKQIEDDLNVKTEETFQEDLTIKGFNQLANDRKVPHIDVSDTAMKASAVSYQKMPWKEVNGKLEDSESSSKKLKSGFSEIYGCRSSRGKESFNGSFASLANNLRPFSSAEDKGCKEACDEKIIHEDFGATERTFFPVDARRKNNSQWKGPHEHEDQFRVGIPNLELALGGETKQPLPLPPQKGMLPFLVGAVDKKNNQEKPQDALADERDDESAAASLSLSLSFPSSNKEPAKPVSKAEQVPDGHHVNTSFLLFGRYADK